MTHTRIKGAPIIKGSIYLLKLLRSVVPFLRSPCYTNKSAKESQQVYSRSTQPEGIGLVASVI